MKTNSRIGEFTRSVRIFESIYSTARVRTLFADRGEGLDAVATVIHLLPDKYEESETVLWSSKLLKIVERFMEYPSADTVLHSIQSDGLELDSTYVGFNEDENPYWDYTVISRDDQFAQIRADSTTLLLSGHITIDDSPHGYETPFTNEMKLNPQLPVKSLQELTHKVLQHEIHDLQYKRVDIIAPSCVLLTDLSYRGDKVVAQIRCMKQITGNIRLKSLFYHQNGNITVFQPRFRGFSLNRLTGNLVEISKDFIVPVEAREAVGVSLTISLQSRLGLDAQYAPNLSVINPVWHVLNLLDESKVGKYFVLQDYEKRLALIKDADLFESIVASLLASCGFIVTFIGGFKMSCRDILATEKRRKITLVCECTTGSPRDKLGPMKSAISELSGKTDITMFVGVVFTSQTISDAERKDATADNVIVKDSSDLRELTEKARGLPNPEGVYQWLGIELRK